MAIDRATADPDAVVIAMKVKLWYIQSVYISNIISIPVKIFASGIVGLIIITTVVLAQNLDKERPRLSDTIEYIKRETIGGKLDFSSVLRSPDEVITDGSGVRFNKNDYYVFLWGKSVRDMGLESTDKAGKLWEEIYGKKLTGPQWTALKIGFEKLIN